MANFTQRIIGAAKLDTAIYEEVESDNTALGQALAVVVLSAVAAGVGLASVTNFATGLVTGIIATLIGWLLWAWLTYFIGTRLLPAPETHADWGQLLRTTGFAASPGILRVLGVVPGLTRVVFLIAGVWMLVAFVIAVRQALDYTSTWRAIGVCFIGWLAYNALLITLALLLGR